MIAAGMSRHAGWRVGAVVALLAVVAGVGVPARAEAAATQVPDQVTLTKLDLGNRSLIASFTAGQSHDSDSNGVTFQYDLDGSGTWHYLAQGFENYGTISGLTNGTSYAVRVREVNSFGGGEPSDPLSGTPRPDVPGQPRNPQATTSDRSAVFTFQPPYYDGGSQITGYDVGVGNGAQASAVTADGSGNETFTVTGLEPMTSYPVSIRAVNVAGSGAEIAYLLGMGPGSPDAPAITEIDPSSQTLTIFYTDPANTGGSSIRRYEYSLDGGAWTTATASGEDGTPTLRITELTNGQTYAVRIRAVNTTGGGLPSTAVNGTPAAQVPLVPQNLVYARGNRSVTLTFTAPYDGGSPITEYQVSTGGWTDLLTSVSGTTVTATVSGLPPGASVSMSVRAVNAAGPGAATDPILVAVVGSPNVPTGLAITPGDTKLALAFTPGAFTGSAETYQYSLDGGVWTDFPATASGSGQAGTISGLTNGRTYAVQVRGTDSWGDGDATAEVNGTPVAFAAARPDPPTAVTAVAHTSSLTVSWAAVDDSTLTGYTATATPGGATCTTDKATTSCLLGGTGGTSYTVTVVANTADSGSEPSDPSNAVVPDSPAVPASAPSGSSVAAPVVTDNGPLSTVSPGQGCVFVAQQFAPLSQVTAVMYSDPVVLGTGTTDADGNVSLSVTIPTGIAAGSHTIALIGVDADGNDRILASKVTAASTTTSPSPGPPAPNDNGTFLPTTGAGVLPLGLLLVVIGATLFLLSRRRGPAAE